MSAVRYLKPVLILLGIALLFWLLNMFGPWNLAVPRPFIRAFLMALSFVMACFLVPALISWLANFGSRRTAREYEASRLAEREVVPVEAVPVAVVEEQYVVPTQQYVVTDDAEWVENQ